MKNIVPVSILLFACEMVCLAGGAQNPSIQWLQTHGSTAVENGVAIATDASGQVYSTGYFRGTIDFDAGPGEQVLTAAGTTDVFVCKYSSSGALIWARSVGGEFADLVYAVGLDGNGNVYISGTFEGVADFDPGPNINSLTSSGQTDVFVLKLSGGGSFEYVKKIGSRSFEDIAFLAVNPAGELVVSGNFFGTLDVNPGGGVSNLVSVGSQDMYIVKLDAAGVFVFGRQFGGTGTETMNNISLDANGNIYTTGSIDGSTDFDPGEGVFNLSSTGFADIFISKLSSDGNFVWAKSLPGNNVGTGESIKADAAGNVFLSANFFGSLDADPSAAVASFISAGNSDILLAKLDAHGGLVFAKRIGGTEEESAGEISTDAAGNIYTTGAFSQEVDFDPGPGTLALNAGVTSDIFAAKYGPAGELVWALAMPGLNSNSGGAGIALAGSNAICVIGSFAGTVDFDPGAGTLSKTSEGEFDACVLQLTNPVSLPLQLLSFAAEAGSRDGRLFWTSANEHNTKQFDIERSADGGQYQVVGKVPSQNQSGTHQYAYTDKDAFAHDNTLFYRLKMTDRDGLYTYSQVVKLSVKPRLSVRILPNPASNFITISGLEGNTTLTLYSSAGQCLEHKMSTSSSVSFNLQHLLPGSYYVRCIVGGQVIVKPFVKQ